MIKIKSITVTQHMEVDIPVSNHTLLEAFRKDLIKKTRMTEEENCQVEVFFTIQSDTLDGTYPPKYKNRK